MNKDLKRRGPGRPPNKPILPLIDKKGIVNSPQDPNNRLEFIYNNPLIFKSLFTYFKNIKARDIHIKCTPNDITFFTRDHLKSSKIFAIISCNQVNWYFCKETFWIRLNRDNVEKIFSSIDKTFFKIIIIQTYDDLNSLLIIFKDSLLDKECIYKIVLSSYTEDNDLYESENFLDNEDSLIEFVLSAKQFKKTIIDANNYSDIITFEKIGDEPLQLNYIRSNIIYNEVYKSDEKIKLKSIIGPNNTFRAVVKLNNIKSLASSMLTNEIYIYCKPDESILFKSVIDLNTVSINTLTKII